MSKQKNSITEYNDLSLDGYNNVALNALDQYIRQGEPEQKEKGLAWTAAIGLQDVDGLKTSSYLLETAKKNIDGDITFSEANTLIESYYRSAPTMKHSADRTEEADKVAARIAEVLSEKTFTFSPTEYLTIHKRLFSGIYDFAGKIRDYNISKAEWILSGKTVFYAGFGSILASLEYDFAKEKNFKFNGLSKEEIAIHIASFVSNLWQIHAFGEGNTRTTAVFIIKYLRIFGFDVDNDLFAQHSWYFRNALVRANFNDLQNNVYASQEFLNRFFRNLILKEQNVLKNRDMHISIGDLSSTLTTTSKQPLAVPKSNDCSPKEQYSAIPKSNDCTLNCTLDEIKLLEFLKHNPKATQIEIASHIEKSERTIKTLTSRLQTKGFLQRKNGKRNGIWIVV